MGTSFYEQNSLSGAHLSFNSMSDSMLYEQQQQPQHHRHDERYHAVDPSKKERRRKKRSSKNNSNSNNSDSHSKIKNSLEQFLVDSQVEDVLFQQQSNADSSVKPKKEEDNLPVPPSAQGGDLFDRNALAAAGQKSSKRHRHRRRKSGGRKQPQQQQQQQPPPRQQQQREQEPLEESSKVFATSLSKIFDGDNDDVASEGSLSLSDLKDPDPPQKPSSRKRRSSKRSRASRPPPSQSTGSSTRLIGIRPRSEITKTNGDLARRLSHLDKQVRRDRMKKEYRTPSVDIRNGGESISTMSTKSSTKSSYRRTGFEGGALNAIMGNESFARIASKGGDIASLSGSVSFCSTPSDDRFLKERRAKQDKILDVAMREKWLRDQTEAKFLEHQMQLDSTASSEEVEKHKKKGLVKKMKKAVRKTAKLSKSGAKVAANAVVDSKRSSRRGYKPAPELIQAEEAPVNPNRREERVKRKKGTSSTRRKSSTTSSTSFETTKSTRKSRGAKPSSFTSLGSSASKKSKKKKGGKPSSFTSHGSSTAASPLSKRAKSSKPNSFASFESTSPFFTKATKGRTVATKLHGNDSKIERGFNDSFSDLFPEFHLAQNSKVVWWDI